MKFVFAALAAALLLLQYRLWVSDEGMQEVWHLRQAVENQASENKVLAERNAQMRAEVNDLKHGLTALEERPQRPRHDAAIQVRFLRARLMYRAEESRRAGRARFHAGLGDALTHGWANASGS
jgi:cell division protein FtsB